MIAGFAANLERDTGEMMGGGLSRGAPPAGRGVVDVAKGSASSA